MPTEATRSFRLQSETRMVSSTCPKDVNNGPARSACARASAGPVGGGGFDQIQRCKERAMPAMAPILQRLRNQAKLWRPKSWAPAGPLQSFPPQRLEPGVSAGTLTKTLDTVASIVSSPYWSTDRAAAAHAATAAKRAAATGCRAPSFAALPRAHVFIPSPPIVIDALARSDERTGTRAHDLSPGTVGGDGPARRLGDRHPVPVVEPCGRSGRDAGRWWLHGQPCLHLESRRAGRRGKFRTPGAWLVRGVETGQKRLAGCGHSADPLEERRQR